MKKICKTLSGLMILYLVVFSCSKDNSPSVSIAPGNIKSQVDSANISFAIRNVTRKVKEDTISIQMTGYSEDSLEKIIINFYKVVGFKPQIFECGTNLYSRTSIWIDFFAHGEHYKCDGIFGDGTITVLSYNSDVITGKFVLNAGKLYDTSKTVKLNGEFSAFFDINYLIKDIDVPRGTMQAKINNTLKNFIVIAAKVSYNGLDTTLSVTGTSDNESIELHFINLNPTSGQVFALDRNLDTSSYIRGTYALDSTSTFVTDRKDSAASARFTIIKISDTYVQGKFEFIARNAIAPYNLVNISEGKFNSIINKDYGK